MRKKNIFLFSVVTLLIFANINNNSNLRIFKKLFFSLQISSILVFGMSCSANAKDNMSVINVFKHSIRTQNLNNNPSLSKLVSKSKLVPKKTGQSSIRKMSININRSCRVSSSFQTSYRTKPA